MKARGVAREGGVEGVYIRSVHGLGLYKTKDITTEALLSPGISILYCVPTRLLCMHSMWF